MRNDFAPAVYLLGSRRNGTLYLGVTSNLLGRIWQHRTEANQGFTAR
jgi:putative endonuclease